MNTKISVVALAAILAIFGCSDRKKEEAAAGSSETEQASAASKGGGEQEVIKIDGSSTVFPISQAVAEEYQNKHGGRVTIGVSGTGGGFKKFCRGEIDISGASRPIKSTEREACAAAGIEFIELPVAYDGIAVVVHKDNDWVDHLTVDELKTMWEPEATDKGLKKWNQIRSDWPDKEFHLFGPGVDSGTYDYFTAAIVGKEHASRGDFTASEDDNVLVQGISTDPVALGFFGYAYYQENAGKLKLIPIDDGDATNGEGPITPDLDTVANGTYQPLSRPIFIYVAKDKIARPGVKGFVEFYLGDEGRPLVEEVGYIPLPDGAYTLVNKRFADQVTGSLFESGSKVGVTVEELLKGGE